jgi:hypothetical protein
MFALIESGAYPGKQWHDNPIAQRQEGSSYLPQHKKGGANAPPFAFIGQGLWIHTNILLPSAAGIPA